MEYTLIKYKYRDASNYKFHGEFVVSGKLRRCQLEDFLFDTEFFVPHEIGLAHLLDMPMNEDDHYLHTFESFEECNGGEIFCSTEEFVSKIKEANKKGWLSSLR